MKKNIVKKLTLNAGTIRRLTPDDLGVLRGGNEQEFTYTLSTGDRCQKSNNFTNDYTCRC
jgi:hypothetical protein